MTENYLDPISKTFWYCIPFVEWPDAVDILFLIFEVSGIILNILTALLLFRIRQGPRQNIVLLQTLSIHCLLVCIINFMEDCNPKGVTTDNYVFNILMCVFWNARFFYWIFFVAAIQCLVFLSIDRALTLYKSDHLRFTSLRRRILVYEVTIHVFSALITLPQVLTVNLKEDECSCAPNKINIPFLTVIYAHVYIWFTILFVTDGSILLCCAYYIMKWVRETPRREQFDDLNELSFEVIREHGHPFEQYLGKGYKTASMCILPLAVSYVITFSYDSTYQFASALGLATFIINSIPQKIGGLFLVIHVNVVPVILLFYLPPLRDFAIRYLLAPLLIAKKPK
ncbi:unnamed protein product [Hymenolepis diminuta]|uniref:G_PROTEIN_RECEP_F1_2 domain-containing protein n=1 Tax=Hymenolepis diminuta TaxID=6216 RepID=A0A0R3SAY6_HYMDI|nr:unnamed protein product [Hymenolepis diminuta]VUZ50090.1 unnamed protein product [Hymenolepis diminuta]